MIKTVNEGPTADDIDERRRAVVGATAGGLALGALGTGSVGSAAAQDGETVTVVHDTHFHGRFEDDVANIAEYWWLIQELQAEHENTLFVGAGDEFSPSLAGSWFEGENILEALNEMDPDGVAVGNHESDFGADRMVELFADSEFPWLATNLAGEDGESPYPETEQWVTTDVGGVSVGLLGFVPPGRAPEGGTSLDLVESTQAAIDHLRQEEGVDLVVAGSHLGGESPKRTLARDVDGLDAIVGDHYATVAEEVQEVEGTAISLAGDEYDHLATLTLDADGRVADRTLYSLAEMELEEDDAMAAIREEYNSILDEELSEEVAYAGQDLDARFDSNYNLENEFGNLVTEAMAEQTDAEIAIQNGGGIRSNRIYERGPLEAGDVYEILPFPDPAVKLEITGAELKATLEEAVAVLPGANFGAQPQIQVHNIHYDWHGIEEPVVENVHVDGEPVADDETFTATLSGPNFGRWQTATGNEDVGPADAGEETDTIGNLVSDHVSDLGYLQPKLHNRIHRFDEDAGEPTAVNAEGGEVVFVYPMPEHALTVHEQTFYAVSRHGTRIESTGVETDEEAVRVAFDAAQFETLSTGPDDPTIRVFGGFDPDSDGYDLVPGSVDVESLPFEVGAGEAQSTDGADGGSDEGSADGGSDGDGENESDADGGESDTSSSSVPGFGPISGAAGISGAAYLYEKYGGDGDERGDNG
ncbi:bifunctional metallophosphatase/5'-nucleotidase [Halobacteriales archaeon SW_8_68_21]|nr:MAG: bifunctional metallophosphatase/5'-nucleotidase [Halobacteriales archaeon SW_8_68_21]